MATQKLITRVAGTPGLTEITAATTGGVGQAGQVPALDPTTGLLALSMMPVGVGPDIDNSGICGATALTAGMYVNIYSNVGVKTVRPADSTDNTKPAHGFVVDGFSASDPVTVYLPGQLNNMIPVGSFTVADSGKVLYLGASGAATTTRVSTTGNLDQPLGVIDNVGTSVSSAFAPEIAITIA